jgi:hypothetical protein
MMSNSTTEKDSILEYFAVVANQKEFTLDLTLNVKGAIVTGTMISAREYFLMLSQTFEDGDEEAQMISEQLQKAGEDSGNTNEGGANFIHLKDAKIYCGDSKPTPSKGSILWRGKLNEIDGFCIGKIHDQKQES